MGWFEGQVWRWTLSWKRELTLEEQIQLANLQGVQQHHPLRNEIDRILWCKKDTFGTKELVSKASKLSHEHAVVDNLTSTVWMSIAPPKVEFMLWLALLGKLNTREMLVKKGIIPLEANLFSFCPSQPETIDHLLLSCTISWNIWSNIVGDLGVRIERHQSFRLFYD